MGVSLQLFEALRSSKMKINKTFSVLILASIANWIEGAPLSKYSNNDEILFPSFSSDICKNLDQQAPGHYLLVDPSDCKKFFSCQYVNRSGWLAYSISCPDGTHFDGVWCVTGDKCRKNKNVNLEVTSTSSKPTTTTSHPTTTTFHPTTTTSQPTTTTSQPTTTTSHPTTTSSHPTTTTEVEGNIEPLTTISSLLDEDISTKVIPTTTETEFSTYTDKGNDVTTIITSSPTTEEAFSTITTEVVFMEEINQENEIISTSETTTEDITDDNESTTEIDEEAIASTEIGTEELQFVETTEDKEIISTTEIQMDALEIGTTGKLSDDDDNKIDNADFETSVSTIEDEFTKEKEEGKSVIIDEDVISTTEIVKENVRASTEIMSDYLEGSGQEIVTEIY